MIKLSLKSPKNPQNCWKTFKLALNSLLVQKTAEHYENSLDIFALVFNNILGN